jgi:hypothetical protein
LGEQYKKNEMDRPLARVGERRDLYRFAVGNLRERDHLEDPDVEGKIILKWVFKK